MKENKEDTQLRLAEDILKNFIRKETEYLQACNRTNALGEITSNDFAAGVIRGMNKVLEEYASQFRSVSPEIPSKESKETVSPKPDIIKVTEEQLHAIDSSDVLKLNDNVYLRKEKCLDILQKWSDKVEAETVVPLKSRIAELESDNKTWEALEQDRGEEIGKLMARVTELTERNERLEKELSDTETALEAAEIRIEKWREYCQRNGLEGL